MQLNAELVVAVAALVIAVASAAVSFFQLSTMRQDLTLSHRAWVTITEAKYFDVEAGKVPRVQIMIRNHGSTPAVGVAVAGAVYMRAKPDDEAADLTKGQLPKTLIIGPSETVTSVLDMDASIPNQSYVDALLDGRVSLFATGVLYYFDVFGAKHSTVFCFQVSGAPPVDNAMHGCQQGRNSLN
ncbi:hypothetical protein LuPra_04539 [Luteitalea pratensis]|uniref:Uncharacterized protein n=2 Tax=Luteitalea pratensis TaxID=1855912 RepID=A0A143PSC5_LUTPR|nr:hypothetical protein LuPra_04539 [Luteitalea pratensis]